MDMVLNYIFIGFAFAFIVDFILNLESVKNHPKAVNLKWGWNERIFAILVWPIGIIIFLFSFIKTSLKK